MNKYTASNIQDIKRYAADYRTETQTALGRYRQRLQKAREKAKEYKDEGGFIDRERDAAAREARQAILGAQYAFQSSIKYSLQGLQDELGDHITKTEPDAKFYDRLRIYRDFNLQPDEAETQRLVDLSRGSYLACRALNSVLEQTRSEYRVKTPSAAEYEKDLKILDQLLAPSALPNVSQDLHRELADCFIGQPYCRIRNDKGDPIDNGDRFDSTSLIAVTFGFDSNLKTLDSMESRWTGSILPSLIRYQPEDGKKPAEAVADYAADLVESMATAASLERHTDGGVAVARQMAQQDAAAAKNAAATIAKYGV